MYVRNKGFTGLEILLIVAFLAVAALAAWVWHFQSNQEQEGEQDDSMEQEEINDDDEAEISTLEPGEVIMLDTPVAMTSETDVEDLPETTPESFVSYVEDQLRNNTPDEENCINQITVRRMSTVNMDVTEGMVDADTGEETCGPRGPYGVVKYTQDGSTWETFAAVHAVPTCEELEATNVYEEFHESCTYTGAEPGETVPNPNGSIAQLAR